MKKLSLLISLILCVTIGGVYAAWEFSGNNIVDEDATITIGMGTVTDSHSPGEYGATTNFSLTIEPLSHVNANAADPDHADYVKDANHIAAIQWNVADSTAVPQITFTFKPTKHATQDQKENGVESSIYFATSASLTGGSAQYNGQKVFTFGATKDVPVTIHKADYTGEGLKWTLGTDGTFTCVIDASEYIRLTSDNFMVDSLAKYNEFKAALGGNILAHITDTVADTPSA
jgi:hypothetical protein